MKYLLLLCTIYFFSPAKSQELIPFIVNSKQGFKNSSGKIVIPAIYSKVMDFSAGLAAVNKGGHFSENLFGELSFVGGKWGYIDKTGKEVIPLQYDYAETFNDFSFQARVRIGVTYFYIDTKGNRQQNNEIKKTYFPNNKLQAEGKEVNGVRSGLWTFYFENGQQKSTENYNVAGKLEGYVSYYHPNGKLLGRDLYKNGVYQKPGDFFDNTGKPTLINGTGFYVTYHTNGAISYRAQFKNHSRDGEVTWFYNNGQLKQKAIYKYSGTDPNGLRWEIVSSFDQYGMAREKGTLKNGNGSWISYDDNGKATTTNYQGGRALVANNNGVTIAENTKFEKAFDLYEKKNYKDAYDMFMGLAIAENHPKAMLMVGHMRINGQSVIADPVEAMDWYKKSAQLGNADAMAAIGGLYYVGKGTAVDYKKAMEWFKKAVDKQHVVSMTAIGELYQDGLGVSKDYQQAMQWYQKASDKGNAIAMRHIGELYYLGLGVSKSFSTAMEWLKKAADRGEVTAMRYVGMMYYRGEGVADNRSEALAWYRKAAEKGDGESMLELGVMYFNGEGVTTNYTTAMDWYEKAAAKGNAIAMRNIGYMYKNGHGATKSLEKSLFWYGRAAETDPKNPDAWNAFAYAHFEMKNYDKAIEVLNKAIKLDPKYANGYDSLGEMYEAKGDRPKAIEFYKKAASMGHENAVKWLKEKGIPTN